MDADELAELRAALRRIDDDRDYYALTLTAEEDGRINLASQTSFVGEGSKPHWELRAASIVDAHYMFRTWDKFGETPLVVNDERCLAIWLRVGGNALIEASIVRERLPSLLEPKESVPTVLLGGVRPLSSVPPTALQHAPSRKLRMSIIQRDDFRCRVCGRRPADHVDIELQVHHIRPHGKGGLTEENNLITLCSTCHPGLAPHFNLHLFELLPGGIPMADIDLDGMHREYVAGVQRYRTLGIGSTPN